MTPERRAALEAEYRRAVYRAGTVSLVIGERSEAADRLLEEWGASSWAFLTAWNPRSEPRVGRENDEDNQRLASLITPLFHVIEGQGGSPDGPWREASFLVVGIAEAEAVSLAERFGQYTFLFGERGGPVRLVWTSVGADP